MNFPALNFDEDHIPQGDSVRMCMGLSWTTLKKRNQYDKYIEMGGMSPCDMYTSGHSRKEADYPNTGINFKLWK